MRRISPNLRSVRKLLSLAYDGVLAIIALWALIAFIGLALIVALAFILAIASAFR